VTCSGGRVFFLKLERNNLQGTIPPLLGNISGLLLLNLTGNQLTGGIPEELGNLSMLEGLYLGDNQLTELPAKLGNLSSLVVLGLGNNQLTGGVPRELGTLPALLRLYLNGNQLSGSIPDELGDLATVQYLYLYDNQLTGNIPPALGNLSSLQRLYLDENQLTGSIPSELSDLSSLDTLWLSENQLSGLISEDLGDYISSLSSYNLLSNKFACPYPSALQKHFSQGGDTCLAAPSALSIEQVDFEDSSIILTVSAIDGGSAITLYEATCTDGEFSYTGSSTTNRIVVSVLTNGVAYTCSVTATNAFGVSEPSLPTAPIVPEALNTGLPIWLLKLAADAAAVQP
jgi:hypothetical protein